MTAKTAAASLSLNSFRVGSNKTNLAAILVLLAVLAAAPYFIYPVFAMKVICFALFACAFNLLLGFGGLLSFGHAAFFGSAAYASAYAAKKWGFSPELSILFSVAVSAVLGAGIGALAIRRSGIYFAMVTLAFAQMVYFFAVQAPFTGGEDGLQSVPRSPLFGIIDITDNRAMYWFVAAIFLGGLALIYRIVHSPFGEVLKAIRDNEQRAISLGYRVYRYKLLTFILSAALTALAGGTKALVFQLASLVDVHWTMSGEVVLITLIGGMGSIIGPVIGAIFIVSMQHYLADIGSWFIVIEGAVFIVCVLLFRGGFVGLIRGLR